MKFNSDYQALAHHWVHNRDHSECYGYRMYSKGNIMYSYGSHYMIAQFIRNKEGEAILFNSDSNSLTTNKQKNCVWSAIPSYMLIFEVPGASSNSVDNIKHYFSKIENNLYNASKARTRKDEYLSNAQNYLHQLIKYIEFFKPKYRFNKAEKLVLNSPITNETGEQLQKASELKYKNLKIKQRKQNKEAYQKELANLELWKKGEKSHIYCSFVQDVFLRINGDYIETSQSAKVLEKEARILYKAYKAGKKVIGSKISNFTIISVNGTVKIGCHEIKMSEIKRLAKLRNW